MLRRLSTESTLPEGSLSIDPDRSTVRSHVDGSVGGKSITGLGENPTPDGELYGVVDQTWQAIDVEELQIGLRGEWEQLAPIPDVEEISQHSAASVNGKMYVFGGLINGTRTNDLWEYNPQTDTWIKLNPLGDLPPARYRMSLVVIEDKLYVFGGVNPSSMRDLWSYDLLNNQWSRLTSRPTTTSWYSAVVIDNKMYVFGGGYSNAFWSYDPQSDEWQELSPSGQLPPGRNEHTAVAIDNKMYVFSGWGNDGTGYWNDLWAYDPQLNEWIELVPEGEVPSGRIDHSAVVVDNRMYIYGGRSGPYLDDLWEYNPISNRWTQLTSGTTARRYHTAVAIDNKMYVFGGQAGSSSYLNDLWVCS